MTTNFGGVDVVLLLGAIAGCHCSVLWLGWRVTTYHKNCFLLSGVYAGIVVVVVVVVVVLVVVVVVVAGGVVAGAGAGVAVAGGAGAGGGGVGAVRGGKLKE